MDTDAEKNTDMRSYHFFAFPKERLMVEMTQTNAVTNQKSYKTLRIAKNCWCRPVLLFVNTVEKLVGQVSIEGFQYLVLV